VVILPPSACTASTVHDLTLINLEQKGKMTSLKVQADVNKPMTDMLGTMIVLKIGKLFAISSSSHKTLPLKLQVSEAYG
jgi:hypothetical protein